MTCTASPGILDRVRADLEIRDAAAYFDERDLASAWVVDEHGRLVGCLREIDFVRHGSISPGTKVGAIMSAALSVEERCSIHEALLRMARGHVRELAIVTADGALVGVVRDVDALKQVAIWDMSLRSLPHP